MPYLVSDAGIPCPRPDGTELDHSFHRICPGRHFTLSTLFINVVSIMAVFDIGKAVDEHGNTVEISDEFTSDFIW